MARIRSIKPEFWVSEQVSECSVNARLLFIGLWTFCDDTGRLPMKPRQIKMQIFPGDPFTPQDIHGMLTELSVNNLIQSYVVDNVEYLRVRGWHHQKINRPQPSKYPAPPPDDSVNAHGTLTPDTIGYDQGEEDTIKEDSPSGESIDSHSAAFSAFNEMAARAGLPQAAKLTRSRAAKLRQRLKDCGGLEGWTAALAKVEATPGLCGGNGRSWRANLDFMLQESTFTKLMEGTYDHWTGSDNEAKWSADRAPNRPSSGGVVATTRAGIAQDERDLE